MGLECEKRACPASRRPWVQFASLKIQNESIEKGGIFLQTKNPSLLLYLYSINLEILIFQSIREVGD